MGGNNRKIALGILALSLLMPFSVSFAKSVPATPTPANSALPDPDSLATRIALRYGLSEFYKVDSIRYKFHLFYNGTNIDREWTWFPKLDSVLYRGKDAKGMILNAAYSRRNTFSMASTTIVGIDQNFINDQYWLLFPLHLKWDKGLKFKVLAGKQPGEEYQLTVIYPANAGYTPGDAYDLFVDQAGIIKRWIFRKANAAEPTVMTGWSAPVKRGGLEISLDHPGPDKNFKLWFTDVKVGVTP